jgi:hypothetical protein
MFHVRPAMADNLGSEIEALNRFQIYWNLFNTPFTLLVKLASPQGRDETINGAYPSILVSLNRIWLITTTKPTIIDKLRKILLDKFLNLGNSTF